MSESGEGATDDPLLTDVLADRLGFAWLSARLPWAVPPLYLYAGAFVFLDLGVVNTYLHLFTDRSHAFLANPFTLAIPAFVVTAATGVRYMASSYRDAVDDLRLGERSDAGDVPFASFTASFRTTAALYAVVVAGYWGYLAWQGMGEYVGSLGAGPTAVIGLVVYPLGFIPVAVQFVVLFASIHVLLPKRIAELRPKPAFLDPRDLGGFYPVGELLKRSYYLYTACLLLYLAYVYGPVLAPLGIDTIADVGAPQAAYFTFLWLFGLAAIGNSVYRIHRVMADEKEAQLRRLEDQLHDIVDDPYDISTADLHDNREFENVQRRLEQVRAMNAYPTTAFASTQILVSVLVPQLTQVALEAGL
ncbi:MAG: hypothetical protein ABEJ90_02275 [Halobacterium sp.]